MPGILVVAGALFASQRDELADKVHAMLFG